jgi:DNA-binding response OmpR family regulator
VVPGEPHSLLLVEQDPEIAMPIVEQLAADGFPTALAHTAAHACALAANSPPALAIIGRLDPPRGALDLLAQIRGEGAPWREDLPVVVLGSPARPADLLRAFAAGADDFLPRPAAGGVGGGGAALAYLELCARLRSLLRRAAHAQASPRAHVSVGPLSIDPRSRVVLLHGQPVRLRPREYALLLHLAREPTRVFTKHELLRVLWGFQAPSCTRTLDSHACRLRRKLAPHAHESWVLSVRAVGYRLTE